MMGLWKWRDSISVELWHGPQFYSIDGRRCPEGMHCAEAIVASAAKSCYESFELGSNLNLKRVREDWRETISGAIKAGHGSVLEHASFGFRVLGCTRVFTAEMNRHRAGMAISERSLRYFKPGCLEFLRLPSFSEATISSLGRVNDIAAAEYYSICSEYQGEDFKEKKIFTSKARRALPMNICVGACYTINLRAMRHIIERRCSPEAEEEICLVVGSMAGLMKSVLPTVFGDFKKDGPFWRSGYGKV